MSYDKISFPSLLESNFIVKSWKDQRRINFIIRFQDSFPFSFFFCGGKHVIQQYDGNLGDFEESPRRKLRCHQRETSGVSFCRGGIYGRRRNSKDEITLRGIRESVVRTRQLGPNRDSPGRARELTRKFQIELAKLEGRPFNEMRSSTAMPKPYLRSPFSSFFFTQPSSCTFLFPLFLSTFRISHFFFFFFLPLPSNEH